MSDRSDATPFDDDDAQALAMDVALGILTEDKVPAHLAADPAFRTALSDWRTRLAPLDATAMPRQPSGELWLRLAASLRLAEVATSQTMAAGAAMAQPRRVGTAAPAPGLLASLWESLSFWRGVGFAGAAASLALAAGLVVMSERARRTPIYVAVLVTDQNETAAIVNTFADGTAELVPTKAFAVPAGKAIEIWTLWDRQVGPRSIGLIEKARTIRLDLRHLPKTTSGQLFEMTLEPATGSPIGRPTGPILTKGTTEVAL